MKTNQTCFVIMPYGVRQVGPRKKLDFDELYREVIAEAVKEAGLDCVRCDDDVSPGPIHKRMMEQIFESRVAVADITTLNANVFYELGVRHALREGVTVIIRREGTSSPFNIAGLSAVTYSSDPAQRRQAIDAIRNAIQAGLRKKEHRDSLVYEALSDVEPPRREPQRITRVLEETWRIEGTNKTIGLVTGDREDINIGEIWVSSENTNMQMDAIYGRSTSATIRYLGARKTPAGRIEEDTIANELAKLLGNENEVAPAHVFVTCAGALEQTNGVKWLFHVAAVRGELRVGYKPITNLERCVVNALREARNPKYGARKILFPIFGTGPGGGDLEEHAKLLFRAAVDALRRDTAHPIEAVYFYVRFDLDLELCRAVLRSMEGLA